MKDRVREAVFNLIGPAVRGTLVVDLFGGTGALGLEAISRGAQFAVIVERHLGTSEMIAQNIAAIGAESRTALVNDDAFAWHARLTEQGLTDELVAKMAIQSERLPFSRKRRVRERLAAEAESWTPPEDPNQWPRLAFVCPPYRFFQTRWDAMRRLTAELVSRSPEGSLVVVESDDSFDTALLPESPAWRVRSYPPAQIAILEV